MMLLMLGFGLMAWAVRGSFQPSAANFGQAIYLAGTALVTIGTGKGAAEGLAAVVVLTAGLCGLAVMTMAVTYLLMVQGSIAQRDSGIMKLTTSSGEPPSALVLLERYAELSFLEQIPKLLQDGRDWCAGVRQSHSALPSLIYFRSVGTGSGWPAALGALLDAGLIMELLVEAPHCRGPAILLREEGMKMIDALTKVVGIEPRRITASAQELRTLVQRLTESGYHVQVEPDLKRFGELRAQHAGCVAAMAEHLGPMDTLLVPPPLPGND
jgi:hypothetical protein